jgi:thymidylate kinase
MSDQRFEDLFAISNTLPGQVFMSSDLVARLVNHLNSSDIAYCYWKSNFSLERSLSGEFDLDLFVDRKSLPSAISILRYLGYKPAVVKWGPGTPNIIHNYGLDSQLGQLSHVHLFSRLPTGESYVKSHYLPLEAMVLENTSNIDMLRVLDKSAELVVFILSTFIKYGSLLDLICLSGRSDNLRAELRWLQAGSDISDSVSLLKIHCPVIDEKLFIKCIEALETNSSLITRVRLARQVRHRLRIYARYISINRVWAYIQLLWGQLRRRLDGNRKNIMLLAGGSVIAFVGPDAVGKSTLVSECKKWLGEAFLIRVVHAGRPPSSLLTAPINAILTLVRRLSPWLGIGRPKRISHSVDLAQSQSIVRSFISLLNALRALSLAYDRQQLLVRARRSAVHGEIVICDRYPSLELGAMDSRRLREDSTQDGLLAAIYNWMARIEEQLYLQIPPPDIVLRLSVSTETAKRRNLERAQATKEDNVYLEERHRQRPYRPIPGTKFIYDIKTEQSLAETILNVKNTIWESL